MRYHSWWEGYSHNFGVEGTGEVLAKGIHFGGVVGTGVIGMDNPFLVPIRERSIVHSKVVHFLGG